MELYLFFLFWWGGGQPNYINQDEQIIYWLGSIQVAHPTTPCASGSFLSAMGHSSPDWHETCILLPSGRNSCQGIWCQILPFSREILMVWDKQVHFSELQVYHPSNEKSHTWHGAFRMITWVRPHKGQVYSINGGWAAADDDDDSEDDVMVLMMIMMLMKLMTMMKKMMMMMVKLRLVTITMKMMMIVTFPLFHPFHNT